MDALTVAQGPVARRDHMWIHLLLATGMRLSAALALTDADVDLERGEILVRHAKGDRTEVVFLGREIRDHLAGFLAERSPGPLFPGRDGRPITRRHAARRLATWMGRSGCRALANPHRLRHDFANRLLRKSGNLGIVQKALGHQAISSTVIYAHSSDDDVRAALAQLGGVPTTEGGMSIGAVRSQRGIP